MSPPPPPQTTPQTHEKKTALDQALSCTTCSYSLPRLGNLYNDLTSGTYSFLRDPPFSSSSLSPREEDEISPLDNSIPPPETGYKDIMTEVQRERYRELVMGAISSVIPDPISLGGTGVGEGTGMRQSADDLKMEVLLRFYQVDYHIHLHYLSGRSVLALCRDVADVLALRRWRWDIVTSGRGEEKGKKYMRVSGGGWTGWPVDNPQMLDLVARWRKQWQERRERVDLARARWVWIMEERRVQRARTVD